MSTGMFMNSWNTSICISTMNTINMDIIPAIPPASRIRTPIGTAARNTAIHTTQTFTTGISIDPPHFSFHMRLLTRHFISAFNDDAVPFFQALNDLDRLSQSFSGFDFPEVVNLRCPLDVDTGSAVVLHD